ncbi:MAG: adenosine kinase [Pseudomonadota bacterium]|nr:adenosine kinase [Pseudomonadota bacterium]
MSKYLVYAIGHSLVDTDVYVDDSDLDHLCIEKGTMTLVDEARQEQIKSYLADKLANAHRACGGSAGNSIIAASQFGAPTYMSCLVADDEDGDIYIDDLEASGVDHGFKYKRARGITGKCLVLITPDAERSMNTFLGVSECLSENDVDEAAIATSTWVYLEGYLVTSPITHAAVMKTRQLADATGAKVAVSFADPGMVTIFRDNMNALLEGGIDFVFSNEVEALAWADTDNLQLAAERLKTICNGFVITRGGSGTILYDGYVMHQIGSQKVNAINSLGAGDMFAGAFFYGLGQGLSMVAACEFASKAASIVVCQAGPRLSMQAARAVRDAHFRN